MGAIAPTPTFRDDWIAVLWRRNTAGAPLYSLPGCRYIVWGITLSRLDQETFATN